MDRSAPVEAVSHLSRGLEGLATLPETLERLQQELDLQVLLGAAWTHISGWATPAIRQVYARARELGQRLGASQQLVAVLLGQFVGYLQQAELQTAQEVAMHLLTQVQGHSDPISLPGGTRDARHGVACPRGGGRGASTPHAEYDPVCPNRPPDPGQPLWFRPRGGRPG